MIYYYIDMVNVLYRLDSSAGLSVIPTVMDDFSLSPDPTHARFFRHPHGLDYSIARNFAPALIQSNPLPYQKDRVGDIPVRLAVLMPSILTLFLMDVCSHTLILSVNSQSHPRIYIPYVNGISMAGLDKWEKNG